MPAVFRALPVAVLAATLALTPTTAIAERGRAEATGADPRVPERGAASALVTAARVVDGQALPADPSATVAMRDLFLSLPALSGQARRSADDLLARPTDRVDQAYGMTYETKSTKSCRRHFCVHFVRRTADAPRSRAWVRTTLRTMERIWDREVADFGYRRPRHDGNRGGDRRFDVYLMDLGGLGYYGYCAPERRGSLPKYTATGYCVLDNDFARSEYHAAPRSSLKVTAAHEFFHAIQYGYDYAEDRWMLESTATWMEDQVFDDINDNRQYLKYGQSKRPGESLDDYSTTGFNQYGNWSFFDYLSDRFGRRVVRHIWTQAAAFPGAPDRYSTAAIRAVLAPHGGLTRAYVGYAARNTTPGRSYPEGRHWPTATIDDRLRLGRVHRNSGWLTSRLDHLTSRSVAVRVGSEIRPRHWSLRVAASGPRPATSPAVMITRFRADGTPRHHWVPLDSSGKARLRLPAGRLVVTVANVSTRFRCWHETTMSCQGRPRDDREPFAVRIKLRHR